VGPACAVGRSTPLGVELHDAAVGESLAHASSVAYPEVGGGRAPSGSARPETSGDAEALERGAEERIAPLGGAG
jgi:hypothetical protein